MVLLHRTPAGTVRMDRALPPVEGSGLKTRSVGFANNCWGGGGGAAVPDSHPIYNSLLQTGLLIAGDKETTISLGNFCGKPKGRCPRSESPGLWRFIYMWGHAFPEAAVKRSTQAWREKQGGHSGELEHTGTSWPGSSCNTGACG